MSRWLAGFGWAFLMVSCGDGAAVELDASLPEENPVDFRPYELLADPHLPARALAGRMRLASSREPEPSDGFGNDDQGHFERVDGDQLYLMEAEGPGVVTRLWFTGREPATQDYSVMDAVVLHVVVDGIDVSWGGSEPGINLGELTGGELTGFERPWVANRGLASNGFVVSVPLGFQDSLALWVEPPPGEDTLFYYQVDWRALPAGSTIRSFDGRLRDAELADLARATDLWVEGTVPVEELVAEPFALRPGETFSTSVERPTVVRDLEAMTLGPSSDLMLSLTVDGELLVDTPLERFFFAAAPAEPHDSALTSAVPGAFSFRYPFPVRDRVVLSLRNEGTELVEGALGIGHDPGGPPGDLRSISFVCDRRRAPAAGNNIVLVDVEGRGHYAGQFLATTAGVEGFWEGFWMLEGDHELFVDSEEILGTGLEDYFGGAFYYLSGSFVLPLAGASGMSGPTDRATVSQYRHHLLGTIPFERSFEFTYESTVGGSDFEYCAVYYRAADTP